MYTVRYEIDIDAESHRQAAEHAAIILKSQLERPRSPEVFAPIFVVQQFGDPADKTVKVELE